MKPISLSINTAAGAIGIGRTKLYELINGGKLDAIKIVRRTLITTASIERFLGVEGGGS